MRPITVVLSIAQLVTLGLALGLFEPDHTASAQQNPAIAPLPAAPPAQQSPVIAPEQIVPQPPKAEEGPANQRPKEETSAPDGAGRSSTALTTNYDVGVIPGLAGCPAGTDLITIGMDDEDNQNANSRSGWIGAIVSSNNTKFVFCRVDGTRFQSAEAPYAVLRLSLAGCPPGSYPFMRHFDNEHHQNQNSTGGTGSIWPNASSNLGAFTELHFCLFHSSQFPQPFPDLGMEYGVFASSLPTRGLASGHLHIDDEDSSNGNFFDVPYYNLGQSAAQIISGNTNTDISIVKVKNEPPHCVPKLVSYNGSTQISASYDGANCYIKPVVSGATPFILGPRYYVASSASSTCAPGTGAFDAVNCYFMPKPAGGFLYNDAFYIAPGSGNTCSLGSFDGANCFIKAAPLGTHAFEYMNKWYFTPLRTCLDGSYDGANCYIMKAPAGVTPFVYNNAFYYHQ